jgi:hypothetical protein
MPSPRVIRLPPQIFRRLALLAKMAGVTASEVIQTAVLQFQELPLAVQRDMLRQFALREFSEADAGPRPHSRPAAGRWLWTEKGWTFQQTPAKRARWFDGVRLALRGAFARLRGCLARAESGPPQPGLADHNGCPGGPDRSQAA